MLFFVFYYSIVCILLFVKSTFFTFFSKNATDDALFLCIIRKTRENNNNIKKRRHFFCYIYYLYCFHCLVKQQVTMTWIWWLPFLNESAYPNKCDSKQFSTLTKSAQQFHDSGILTRRRPIVLRMTSWTVSVVLRVQQIIGTPMRGRSSI